jgi:sulfoxide reductase heme-binding subunit YedZ
MIALTSPYLWYVTRATGLVTLVLFTIVVCLGTFVANRVGGTNVGRFELNELHRSVSMTAMAFLVLHILSTILDSYVPTGWLSAVIPMTSSYKRSTSRSGRGLRLDAGGVGVEPDEGPHRQRIVAIHPLVPGWPFVAAIVHGFLIGTDARSGIGLAVVISCALVVVATALWRYLKRPDARRWVERRCRPSRRTRRPRPNLRRGPRDTNRRSRVPR